MNISPYKALIFDMGEVLVRTYDRQPRTLLAKTFNLSFEQLEKLVYFSESALKSFAGKISDEDHFRGVLMDLGKPGMDYRDFQDAFWAGDDIDKEMLGFISSLRSKFKLGLLSNAMDTTRERLNKDYNLSDYFDVSVYSYEVNLAKPSPEIYKIILHQLDVEPHQAIFIDDLKENIEAAQKLGLTTIQHKSTSLTIAKLYELLKLNQSVP